jgi:hypothetical protein
MLTGSVLMLSVLVLTKCSGGTKTSSITTSVVACSASVAAGSITPRTRESRLSSDAAVAFDAVKLVTKILADRLLGKRNSTSVAVMMTSLASKCVLSSCSSSNAVVAWGSRQRLVGAGFMAVVVLIGFVGSCSDCGATKSSVAASVRLAMSCVVFAFLAIKLGLFFFGVLLILVAV